MTTRDDALTTLEPPDRLYYATGVFLDAEDLEAEQRYHRGRLARVLDYVQGTGTIAGLRVDYKADKDELEVSAGLAIDRVGRLVELPRIACMDLGRWFTYWKQLNQVLRTKNANGAALTEEESALTGAASRFLTSLSADTQTLFVDVHIRFAVCERGRTPAFANGPWDALDATAPSRLRDGWEVLLTPRGGSDLSLPSKRQWPEATPGEDLGLWQRRMEDHLLGNSWHHGSAAWTGNAPNHDASTEGLEDSTAIFLGRVSIPVTLTGGIPTRRADPVTVNNHARLFVLPNAALVSWLRAIQGTFRL